MHDRLPSKSAITLIPAKRFEQHHQNLDGPAALQDQAFRFIRDNIRTGRN